MFEHKCMCCGAKVVEKRGGGWRHVRRADTAACARRSGRNNGAPPLVCLYLTPDQIRARALKRVAREKEFEHLLKHRRKDDDKLRAEIEALLSAPREAPKEP